MSPTSITTRSGGMTGAAEISSGMVMPSGVVRVGLAGVEGAMGVADTGGLGGNFGDVWATRHRPAAQGKKIRKNFISHGIKQVHTSGAHPRCKPAVPACRVNQATNQATSSDPKNPSRRAR